MPGQYRLKLLFAVLPQPSQRTALVPPHQTGVADHVGGKDGREFSLLPSQAALRRRKEDYTLFRAALTAKAYRTAAATLGSSRPAAIRRKIRCRSCSICR